MPTVLLVRHAESTWNRTGRIQGWAPTTLTDRGREQARALASHLRRRYAVDRVVASDLQRARATARPLAAEAGVDPEFEPTWRERDVGRFQGLDAADLFERYPRHSLSASGPAAAAERPPGGESLLDARERVLGAWGDLLGGLDGDETAVVVSHGGPLYLLLGHLRGEAIDAAVLERSQDNCAINELRVDGTAADRGEPPAESETAADGGVRIVRENETGFLE